MAGLSGLVQIPVTTPGRLFAEVTGTTSARAAVQTSLTGRTVNAIPGQSEELLIDELGFVNVRFTFGQMVSWGVSLEALVGTPGQIDSPSDGRTQISDFGSSAVIGQVTRLQVDTDGNGSFETILTNSFGISSALGINYLSVPEPGADVLLATAFLAGGRPSRRRRTRCSGRPPVPAASE